MEKKTNIGRRFTGKFDSFENNQERNFYKKALKAYIRGWSQFRFGYDDLGMPVYHHTPQQYYNYENPELL